MRLQLQAGAALAALLLLGMSVQAGVRIEGVDDPLKSNILAHMRLDDESCDQQLARVRYQFSRATDAIRAGLRPFGYYEPEIEASLETPEGECWQAVFRVEPGEPVLISAVNIAVQGGEDTQLPVFERLIRESGIVVGEQLEHDAYQALKSRFLVAAHEYGFFEAKLAESAIRVDRTAHSAEIALVLDAGPRYRFGELVIKDEILDERLLHRYVDFQEGAPFEQRRVRKLHNDLIRGDYFATVDVRALPREEENVADVVLRLEEGRRVRYGVGAGFGTDTGLVVRADLVHRRVNRYGHRLELDTELSKVRQNATIDYRVPGKRPQNDWYSFYGGVNRQDTDAIESISWKVGVRENRFHTLSWSSTPFTELVVERFLQDGEWSQKTSLVPGWGVNYVTANAPARPTKGIRLRGEVAGALKDVLSDASFLRFYFNGKTILPLSERGRLLIRGEAGWMATDDFDKVPPTWRFFAGGDRSVRGYDYQSLGPLDDEGKAIGGRRLLTGSIEGDWRFRERWSGALFVDAGNVGEADLLKSLPWSVGAGVRWYSPVGPIRLDLAFPQNGTSDFRVHVSMGPDL